MLKRSPFCRTIHLHIRNTYDQGRAKLRSERGSEKEEWGMESIDEPTSLLCLRYSFYSICGLYYLAKHCNTFFLLVQISPGPNLINRLGAYLGA